MIVCKITLVAMLPFDYPFFVTPVFLGYPILRSAFSGGTVFGAGGEYTFLNVPLYKVCFLVGLVFTDRRCLAG